MANPPTPARKGTFRSLVRAGVRRSSFNLSGRSQSPPPPPASESDSGSATGSLKQIDTALAPPAPAVTVAPSPIAESPAREAAATPQDVVKGRSPLSNGNVTKTTEPAQLPAPAPAVQPARVSTPASISAPVATESKLQSGPASKPASMPAPEPISMPASVLMPEPASKPASILMPEPQATSKPASVKMPEPQPVPAPAIPAVVVNEPSTHSFTTEPEDYTGTYSDTEQAADAGPNNYFNIPRTTTPPQLEEQEHSNVWADEPQYPAPAPVQSSSAPALSKAQSKSNLSFASSRGRGSSLSSSQPQQSRGVSARRSRASMRGVQAAVQPKESTTFSWSNDSVVNYGQHAPIPLRDPFADPPQQNIPIPEPVVRPSPSETIHIPEPYDPRSPRDDVYVPAPAPQAPVAMALPAMHEVVLSRTVRGYESSSRLMEPSEVDESERRPLRPSTPPINTGFAYGSTGVTYRDVPYGYASASPHVTQAYRAEGAGVGQPVPGGWTAQALPHGARYFVHHAMRATADVDPRRSEVTRIVETTLEDAGGLRQGCEIWVRQSKKGRKRTNPFDIFWVDHNNRCISREAPGARAEDSEDDSLDDEFRYWTFVETHPVHIALMGQARREAIDALNWTMTDRLQGSPDHAPPPFSQEECRDLLNFLISDASLESDIQRAVQTRMIARILLRVVRWRQANYRPHKQLPRDIVPARVSRRISLPRTLLDIVVSVVCLGIPLLFADRAQHSQTDIESGARYAWPLLAVSGVACLVAAIILSASVTLMTLPNVGTFSRIAVLVAILFSTMSMISSFLAFVRYKTDLSRPTNHIGGEGFVWITRRTMLLSLPLVFLAYSTAGFITGVVIYAFRGATVSITSSGVPVVTYRFEEWMRWAVVGVLGGFAGVLIASTMVTRR